MKEHYEFYLEMLDFSIQTIENLSNGQGLSSEEIYHYLKTDAERCRHYFDELKSELALDFAKLKCI